MADPRTPQLYCPAGLAARTSRRTAWLVAAAIAAVLATIAVATPWGARGALIAFAAVWGLWMVLMPVAVIASAVRR
ncbi:MAG TPA: hypothetical protein VFY44_00305 [Thermoleophilaceae bacterium]|nr:hypothetical protein [Thermoleophilaceae bacterium]